MQLRTARLCLDCEEVHEAQQCPVCASETFAYLSRWIEVRERRTQPRPPVDDSTVDKERLEAVRVLTTGRVLTGSVVGITALGVLGWLWRRGNSGTAAAAPERSEPTGSQPRASHAQDVPAPEGERGSADRVANQR